MTVQRKPTPKSPTASQANRAFWADPALRVAQQTRVNGGDGSPHAKLSAAPTATPPARGVAPRQSRQLRDARAGRPVKALPSRNARAARRRVRRAKRQGNAALRVIGALFILFALAMVVGTVAGN